MSENLTATATDTTQKTDATAAASAAAPASDQKPAAAAAPATDAKPAADAKPASDAKADDGKAKSPVSTQKPASLISDAGKAQPNADDKKGADASDGKKDDANKDGKKDGEAAKGTVPEKYDIKVAEGITLDPADVEEFTPIAKKYGLTNEAVQEIVDFETKRIAKHTQNAIATQDTDFNNFKQKNHDDTVAFYGNKLEGELKFVAKGRDTFADAEVMELLDGAGIGSHKAIVAMFAKMGRTVSEDKLVDGKRDTGKDQRTPGSIIYAKDK